MTRSQHETGHCPFREDALYNRGLRDESEFSIRGTVYHHVMKLYIKRLVAAQVPMDFEEANQAFHQGVAESKCPPQLVSEVREIFDRAVQHFELDLDSFLEVEDHRVCYTKDGIPFWIRADFALGHVQRQEIEGVDHKTFHVALTDAQARDLYQTRYTIWALMQIYDGWASYRMTYLFPRLNKSASWVFYKEDFDMLDREVRAEEAARRQRYADNDWPAIPGDQCAFCSLACPVMDDEDRANVRVNSPESFARAAGWLIVDEKRQSAIKKSLKAYANANGPQNINGEIFGFRATVSKSYDAAAVVDMVRASTEIAPVFVVSLSALKAQCKIVPGLEADLALLERRKESARFGHKSLKQSLKEAAESEDGEDE